MAKQKASAQKSLSPELYIREKARKLPIAHCYMSKNWEEAGEANVIVVRKHPQGTFTLGYYLIDTYCRGVEKSFYRFSMSEMDFKDFIKNVQIDEFVQEVPYEEVHNLIYGALSFAEEAGIEPDKSFDLTQYLLEEDTDEIPLIEYEYGKDGQHYLVADSRLEASRYLPLLEKNLGKYFKYVIAGEKMDRAADWVDNFLQDLPETEYTYQHPAYPDKLDLEYPEIYDLFASPKNMYSLKEEDIDRLLALPHDALRHDVGQILLYETGRTCDGISDAQWSADSSGILMHALFFLGEVGDEGSLKVVLETLRQNMDYYDYHIGDTGPEIYVPTLYLLGKDRLDVLLDYIKEPGLYTFARVQVFPAVALVARLDAGRRSEVIEWFRQVLNFYTEKFPEAVYGDGILAGMMLSDLIDINAKELLPEIEAMFATGCVDKGCCGNFEDVKKAMMKTHTYLEPYILDIYQRYQEYYKRWGKRI